MVKVSLCDPFFWEQPSVLVSSAWWNRYTKSHNDQCASEVVNEVAAVYLFTLIVTAFLSVAIEYPYGIPVGILIATVYLIPAFMSLSSKKAKIEPPDEGVMTREAFTPAPTETVPTAKNPFMNVLIDQIKYDPTRPQAADIQHPQINDALDDFFRVQWSSDPTDVFGRTQSQRQFIAMPSTSIPNDQGAFQNWLYKIPGKTCKEGGKQACLPGSDGSPVTWLNQDR